MSFGDAPIIVGKGVFYYHYMMETDGNQTAPVSNKELSNHRTM